MGGDEGAGDGQPDPGPAVGPVAGGIGAIEPFEDVRQVVGSDAVAGVGDGDVTTVTRSSSNAAARRSSIWLPFALSSAYP